jgi:hypothetical protein
MRKVVAALLWATLATLGAAAALPLPKTHKLLIEKAVEPVGCVGNRRNYRDFNHCWRMRGRRSHRANYCSRICR